MLKASGLLAAVTYEMVSEAIVRVFGGRRVLVAADEYSRLLQACPELCCCSDTLEAPHLQPAANFERCCHQWPFVCSGLVSRELATLPWRWRAKEISLPGTLSAELAPLRDKVWALVQTSEDVVAYQCAVPGIMGAYLAAVAAAVGSHQPPPPLCEFLRGLPFAQNVVSTVSETTSLLVLLWMQSDEDLESAPPPPLPLDSIRVKLQEHGVAVDSPGHLGAVTVFHPVALYALFADDVASPQVTAPHFVAVREVVQELFAALREVPFRKEGPDPLGDESVNDFLRFFCAPGRVKTCIETFIAVALRVRASVPGKHVDVQSLVVGVCGGYDATEESRIMKHYDSQLKLKKTAALLHPEEFRVLAPVALEPLRGRTSGSVSKVDLRRWNEALEERFAKSPLAVITMPSIPTLSSCDVALIGSLEDGHRVLIVFDSQCCSVTSSVSPAALRKKVKSCLEGVAKIEEGLRISRVCFVLCSASWAPEPPRFASGAAKRLSRKVGMRSAVTLHVVRSEDAWRRLLLHTFHLMLPGVDGDRRRTFGDGP